VVHQLRDAPLDRPQGGLDGCKCAKQHQHSSVISILLHDGRSFPRLMMSPDYSIIMIKKKCSS
jgi:hypothetical protein